MLVCEQRLGFCSLTDTSYMPTSMLPSLKWASSHFFQESGENKYFASHDVLTCYNDMNYVNT